MLEQLLDQLSQELELPPFSPKDDKQMFHVLLNPSMRISMRELDPGILFFSQVGPCPVQKKEELFILLMKANFLGQGTGGGVIALDPEEKFLTLSSALPYDMNYKAFKGALEDFANFVDYWREELINHQKAAETSIYS
jgi:hypothetical protein